MTSPTDVLAARFDRERGRLNAVATRLLGDPAAAEDAVQEGWLRLARYDGPAIDNLPAWLTTVVSRICLDQLRVKRPHAVDPDLHLVDVVAPDQESPGASIELADSISTALFLVLDTLSPTERVTFVLHDLFRVPFPEVAGILGTSHASARQLGSRARRRVHRRTSRPRPTDRDLVDAFLDGSRRGDVTQLLQLLAPDVVLEADAAAAALGAECRVAGADAVAGTFAARARGARSADISGRAGAPWMLDHEPKVLFTFDIRDGQITRIGMLSDPSVLADWAGER